jgi:hypothetical protein
MTSGIFHWNSSRKFKSCRQSLPQPMMGFEVVHSVGMTGFEPAASTSRTSNRRVLSVNGQEVAAGNFGVCTTVCTSSEADPRGPDEADTFASAVAVIVSLPLSDTEKAEAVRRLLRKAEGP